MWKPKDLKGQRFTRLVAIEPLKERNHKRHVVWLCKCDCGVECEKSGVDLLRGHVKSCGCLTYERKHNGINHTHGYTRNNKTTPEYVAWMQMKARCYDERVLYYYRYGGRGIIVCDRWLGEDGFVNFLSDMGERPTPKHSLDRYPDKNGNYFKENCRWATKREQAGNTANNKWIEYNGQNMIYADWARFLNTHPSNIASMLKYHGSFEYVYNFYMNKNKK